MSQQDIIDRGSRAEKLLSDKDLDGAFSNVKLAIYSAIDAAPVRATQGIMQLKLMLKLLRDVRANLEEAVRSGKLERATIEQEEKQRRFKLFGR